MRDLYHNVKATQVVVPATQTATVTSSAIDMKGYDSLSVLFDVGNSGDTLSGSVFWTLKLQDSDDDSVYADVGTSGLLNSTATTVIDAPSEDSLAVAFGYIGGKRYVKAVATKTGTHTNGTPMGVIALQGNAAQRPVA